MRGKTRRRSRSSRSSALNFEPIGGTLNSYATIQVWAQAVEQAGTFKFASVAQTLRSKRFETVLGTIGFDAKGDVVASQRVVVENGNITEYRVTLKVTFVLR